MQQNKKQDNNELEDIVRQKERKGFFKKLRNTVTLKLFTYGAALALSFGCVTATKQPSVFQTNPSLLTRQYTADQITTIQKDFEANPLQYSQELGNLLLWQIDNKNCAFGRQLAELPDLNDGIDPKEDEALRTIHEYIKDVQFPSDFASEEKLDKPSTAMSIGNIVDYHLLVEWTSEQEESNKAMVLITDLTSNITLKEAKPRGFESNDKIDYVSSANKKTDSVMVNLTSSTNPNDKDGLELKFSAEMSHSIDFEMHGRSVKYEIQNLSKPSKIESPRKYDKVTILEEMTLDGLKHDEYRHSPSLEAFLWLIMDGKFDAESFERQYSDSLGFLAEKKGGFENLTTLGLGRIYPASFYFTLALWDNMKGPRWENFNIVVDRLNDYKLLDYYEQENFKYEYYRGDWQTNKSVFKRKRGNCYDITDFTVECLRRAGYKAGNINFDIGEGHSMCYFKDGDRLFLMNNGVRMPGGILGPYDSFKDMPFRIRRFVN